MVGIFCLNSLKFVEKFSCRELKSKGSMVGIYKTIIKFLNIGITMWDKYSTIERSIDSEEICKIGDGVKVKLDNMKG